MSQISSTSFKDQTSQNTVTAADNVFPSSISISPVSTGSVYYNSNTNFLREAASNSAPVSSCYGFYSPYLGTGHGVVAGSTLTEAFKSVNANSTFPVVLSSGSEETYQGQQQQNSIFNKTEIGGVEACSMVENPEYLRNSALSSSHINYVDVNVSPENQTYPGTTHQYCLGDHKFMLNSSTPPLPQYPTLLPLMKSPPTVDPLSSLTSFKYSRGVPESANLNYETVTMANLSSPRNGVRRFDR